MMAAMDVSNDINQQAEGTPTLVLDVSDIDKFDVADSDTTVPIENDAAQKEMLRKIKKQEKRKLSRIRKKSLSSHLATLTPTGLQQSVATLAKTIGDRPQGFLDVSKPNDLFTTKVETMSIAGQGSAYNTSVTSPVSRFSNTCNVNQSSAFCTPLTSSANVASTNETAVCVLYASTPFAAMGNLDLGYINDSLEQCMFSDLTMISKLRIEKTYLSTSRRIWIICHSQLTANWVVKKVSELPDFNGRKYSAYASKDIDGLTKISVLVPKECSMVQNFNDLTRFLIIQNPVLINGRTLQELPISLAPLQEDIQFPNVLQDNKEVTGNINGTNCNDDKNLVQPTSSDSCTNGTAHSDDNVASENKEDAETIGEVELEKPMRDLVLEKPMPSAAACARTYIFYADDTWVRELRRLDYRPYLGVRRLLCIEQEKVLLGIRERQRKKKRNVSARKKKFGVKAELVTPVTVLDSINEDDGFQ